MDIINLTDSITLKPWDFYADIAEDEGPTAIIMRINNDGSEDRVGEYNIPWESVKLEEANNGREPTLAEEYDALIKWLESYTDIKIMYIAPDLISYFDNSYEYECYIDPADGLAKFCDSEE